MTVPTDTSVTLYKEGVASPPLHPIDVGGWLNLGWSYEKEENAKAETKAETKAEENAEGNVIASPEVASDPTPVVEPVTEPVEPHTGKRRRSQN